MKTFKKSPCAPPPHAPFLFLSWRRIRVHVRSSPKWLKIYDINKNTKRTTLTRKTRAAAGASGSGFSTAGNVFRASSISIGWMRKATGYIPVPSLSFSPPWSITCQCARNENTNKLIFGLVKFNFFTSIQCPQKRSDLRRERSKRQGGQGVGAGG